MICGLRKDFLINNKYKTTLMKTKVGLFIAIFTMIFSGKVIAQAPDDCAITLSYFIEPAKARNYEAALPHYNKVITECPKVSLATYQYAVRMFEYFINEKNDTSKVKDLIETWQLRLEHFPNRTSEGEVLMTIAQLEFDYNIGTKESQFKSFDTAFKKDPENFTSGKSLYTYFSLAVDLFNEGKKELQEIFDLYDIVIGKIDVEKNKLAQNLTALMEKSETEGLDDREKRNMDVYENNLEVYSTVETSVEGKLGQLADCENLIPFYEKDFEAKKSDINWLKAASNFLDSKECDSDLSAKLAVRLHELEPSSTSAYLLGRRAEAEGKSSQALKYFNEAANLEQDNTKKSRIFYSIAENYRKSGRYADARTYYNRMLQVRPSAGIAYYKIGTMYAESTDNCGNTVFEKRAIYWLAADMMDKAASVDGSLAKNARAAAESYRQRAPQKNDIFVEGKAGETITFNCWVGGSVKVPNL